MNTLATEQFRAERHPNGDVLISCNGSDENNSTAHIPVEIKIPKEICKELSELLWPNVSVNQPE